jgi:hypothetical protein
MTYRLLGGENHVIALLKHSDCAHFVDLRTMAGTQWGMMVTAMQEPFPGLKYLELLEFTDTLELPSDSWVNLLHFYKLVCTASPFQNHQHFFCGLVTSFLFISTIYPRLVAFHRRRWLPVCLD